MENGTGLSGLRSVGSKAKYHHQRVLGTDEANPVAEVSKESSTETFQRHRRRKLAAVSVAEILQPLLDLVFGPELSGALRLWDGSDFIGSCGHWGSWV